MELKPIADRPLQTPKIDFFNKKNRFLTNLCVKEEMQTEIKSYLPLNKGGNTVYGNLCDIRDTRRGSKGPKSLCYDYSKKSLKGAPHGWTMFFPEMGVIKQESQCQARDISCSNYSGPRG